MSSNFLATALVAIGQLSAPGLRSRAQVGRNYADLLEDAQAIGLEPGLCWAAALESVDRDTRIRHLFVARGNPPKRTLVGSHPTRSDRELSAGMRKSLCR